MGDALEALRIVAVLASPAMPARVPARCGGASAWRAIRPTERLPDAAAWGGYPGGLPVERARRSSRAARTELDVWTDSHCHLDYGADMAADAVERARAAGVDPHGDRRHRRRALGRGHRGGGAHDGVWATAGAAPPRRQAGRRRHRGAARRAQGRRRGRVRARLPLRPLAARRAAGGLRGPDRAGPRARPRARDPHAARRGTTPSPSSPPRACPSARCSTASRAAPTRPGAALDLGAYLSFSGIVTFKNADDVRAAAALCPLDRLLVETDAPFLAPVPHRGEAQRTGPRGAGRGGRGRGQGASGGRRRRRHHRRRRGAFSAF